jgi:hypothetical protein
MNQMSMQ